MTHAFGAKLRVDLVNFRAHRNGQVGTFWFANVAIDAVISDVKGHGDAVLVVSIQLVEKP